MNSDADLIHAGIILAGGSGERFWPLSRRLRPKQLLRLTDPERTMLQEAVDRLAPVVERERVFVVTGGHLQEPIRKGGIGLDDANVLAEPAKRNTCGALCFAAASLMARFGDPAGIVMAVTTADHEIPDTAAFCATVRVALAAAADGQALVTMGIQPTRPETGYGYIQAREAASASGGKQVFPVSAFHEKPNRDKAEDFIETGEYFWNSGMFFWRLDAFLRELGDARPEFAEITRQLARAIAREDSVEVARLFDTFEDISIDYALLEHAKHRLMVRAEFPWDDVGEWSALDRSHPRDARGNVAIGDPIIEGAGDCIIYNEAGPGRMAVAAVGVRDLVIVVTDDAVLVVPKSEAQSVRKAVQQLRDQGRSQV